MYASVRRYKFDPKHREELNQKVQELFVPLIKKTPGFVAYYYVDSGKGAAATFSLFDNQAGAEESTRIAATFIKENLASMLTNPPEITLGEVVAQATRK